MQAHIPYVFAKLSNLSYGSDFFLGNQFFSTNCFNSILIKIRLHNIDQNDQLLSDDPL